MLLIAMKFSLI
jgi:hypothetical protein